MVAFAVFPARSVAVQVTVWSPIVLVSIAPQLDVATPDAASVAFGAALTPVWCNVTGPTAGLSVGGVRSTLNATCLMALALPLASWLPAYSVCTPSALTLLGHPPARSPNAAGGVGGSSVQRTSGDGSTSS